MADTLLIAVMTIILTIISSGLALMVWSTSRRDFRRPFAVLIVFQTLIAWTYLMEINSTTIEGKMFWNNFEYLGYLVSISSFVLFALQYARNVKVDLKLGVILAVPPTFFLAAVVTNPAHRLFYVSTELADNFYRSFNPVYGPVFYVYTGYAVVMMVTGLGILLQHYLRSAHAHRTRVGITCLACGMDIGAVMLNFSAVSSVPGGLLIGVGFLIANVLMFIGAFGFELFSMVPFGLDKVMNTTRSVVFILDDSDVIMYQNPSADALVGGTGVDYKHHLSDLLPSFPRSLLGGNKSAPREEEDVHEVLPGRHFDVTVQLIHDHTGQVVGKTVLLREITAQRAAEAEARSANYKLDLMNSITRHDVMNQLTVLQGNLMLAGSKTDPMAIQEHISASYQAAGNIQRQMDFAREYQEIGRRVPVWQDVGEKIREVGSAIDLKGARMDVEVKGLEVLADPLLEKVLYNLIDNSLAHGGKVGRMSFTAREVSGGLEMVYSDDGAGVPVHMKAGLFTKGFGTNNGLGLYLSREILLHSEMTITEEGRPGRGARFVIHVPRGRFRTTVGCGAMTASLAQVDQPVRAG
jgi:signal transduction histidine kinase